MFEKFIFNILYYVIWIIEIIGIAIIVFGTFYSLFKLFWNKYKKFKSKDKSSSSIKLVLANYLALGLEFMLAAEILRTVTINREWSEIIVLGSIIILRATMSLLIYWELSYEEKREILNERKKNRNNQITL
jgi:uncharacterized membrane protein